MVSAMVSAHLLNTRERSLEDSNAWLSVTISATGSSVRRFDVKLSCTAQFASLHFVVCQVHFLFLDVNSVQRLVARKVDDTGRTRETRVSVTCLTRNGEIRAGGQLLRVLTGHVNDERAGDNHAAQLIGVEMQ